MHSKIFVTSDTHFGHKNILRYCERPFDNIEEMNEYLISQWNSRVGVDDTVYFLGDFAMGPGVDDQFIISILMRLNGDLKIVLGNHDQPNKKYKQTGLKRLIYLYKMSIDLLPDIYETSIEGTHFVMCHYPMSDWNGKFKNSVHLHGHTHTTFSESNAIVNKQDPSENVRRLNHGIPRRYDVGVDMYGGPVQITGDLRYLNHPDGWMIQL